MEKINYWLVCTSSANWESCKEHKLWGVDRFKSAYRQTQISKTKQGDILIFYVIHKGVSGYARVDSKVFLSEKPVWCDGVYPVRINVEFLKNIEREALPFAVLVDIKNDITNTPLYNGLCIRGKSMIPITDGPLLVEAIENA